MPIVSGLIGAFVIVLFFTFVVIPNQEVSTPDLIISNGHDATKLGDESILSVEKSLSLVELFEKYALGQLADWDLRREFFLLLASSVRGAARSAASPVGHKLEVLSEKIQKYSPTFLILFTIKNIPQIKKK